MRKMLLFAVVSLGLAILLAAPAAAQDRAVMSAPVIRSTAEEIVISAKFTNFGADRHYRIGFGAVEQVPQMTVELLKDDQPVQVEPTNFTQGNTSGWWQVEAVKARGYVLQGADLPGQEGNLVFRVTLKRSEAEKYAKLYIFVARNYGGNRWYLEDGTVIEKSDW